MRHAPSLPAILPALPTILAGLLTSSSCRGLPAEAPDQPVLSGYDFAAPLARFPMPGRLDEISGLAMDERGRLFAHDDERATVHEIDVRTGEVGKRFSLREGPRGDFEGIAIAGERFFLVTSDGQLYEFREGEDRTEVPYRRTDTGLGARCEVEGLDHDLVDDVLLLACKRASSDGAAIFIHRLPLDPARGPLGSIEIARDQLPGLGLDDDFQPSGVVASAAGTLLLSSAVGEMLIEVDRGGRLLAGIALDPGRHPQTEGLMIGPDGVLYLSDERNDQDGYVTVFEPLRGEGGGA